jgi:hypothetical protein
MIVGGCPGEHIDQGLGESMLDVPGDIAAPERREPQIQVGDQHIDAGSGPREGDRVFRSRKQAYSKPLPQRTFHPKAQQGRVMHEHDYGLLILWFSGLHFSVILFLIATNCNSM